MFEDIESSAKHNRVLALCKRFLDGDIINKQAEAERYQVNEKSIQRDIDDLRSFFAEIDVDEGSTRELIYDRGQKGYRLIGSSAKELSNSEALAVCKILLESRAFTKKEMYGIINKIISGCVPKRNLKQVSELILNEKFYYSEPHHKQMVVSKMWDIGKAIQEHRAIAVEYIRKDGSLVKRTLEPVGLMFSEYYFYLTAFIESIDKTNEFANKDDIFPTVYRVDRIKKFRILDRRFAVPYSNRFQEGEFRKRVQFMYGGTLQKIEFEYTGPAIESVLDRLPTAEIEKQEGTKYTIKAEVFGIGIEQWLKSQGSMVKVLAPKELVDIIINELDACRKYYK